jgi:hypothetical protein
MKQLLTNINFYILNQNFQIEIMEILYSRIGMDWIWVKMPKSFSKNVINSNFTLENFKNQFKIYEFIDEISAKKYLKEK